MRAGMDKEEPDIPKDNFNHQGETSELKICG